MSLSILIMSLEERAPLLHALETELYRQMDKDHLDIEVVIELDNGKANYSDKYRWGLNRCKGDYVCSLDDDDFVAGNYLKSITTLEDLHSDVITFNLLRCDNGDTWKFKPKQKDFTPSKSGYLMMANQLCAWKREILLKAPMMNMPCFSDVPYARLLNFHKEYISHVHIPRILYLYRYNAELSRRQQPNHYIEARRIAAGGIDGWKNLFTGDLYLSEASLNAGSHNTVIVRSAGGQFETHEKSNLQHLFRIDI